MKKNRYVLIALAFLLGVFVLEYYFLIPGSEILRDSIRTDYYSLQKYEYFVKGAGITEVEIESAIKDMKDLENRLIKERSEQLASARLQGEISGYAGKAGLNILTIRPLNAEKLNNFSSIPLYFEGNGDIKQIADFLKSLESGSFIMKIDKLNLNVTNVQNPKILKFRIQVSGLMKI